LKDSSFESPNARSLQPKSWRKKVVDEVLSRRALNRATLARQLLLERTNMPALDAIERLAGMQAQEARPPFVGLWTRLAEFRAEQLTDLLRSREVVRATAMRATLHLMSARDYLAIRSTLQPMLTSGMAAVLKERMAEIDMEALVQCAREHYATGPCTFDALRGYLASRMPEGDVRALAYGVRTHLPLVQVPTETRWAFPTAADFVPADVWLGQRPSPEDRRGELVMRYLAAFGPASVADAETWSYMKGLKPVFEALRPKIVTFRDEKKRELFDLADAPRPPEETPAPVRFLPEYDNLVLSHADRTRIVPEEHRKKIVTANLRVHATFLVDGFVAGTWKVDFKKIASLIIEPFTPLHSSVQSELEAEGERLIRFVAPDATAHIVHLRTLSRKD
jgi:hypothetical protein